MRSAILVFLPLVWGVGCSDSEDGAPVEPTDARAQDADAHDDEAVEPPPDAALDAEGADAATPWTPGVLDWTNCTLPGPVAGECVDIELPADWDDVDGPTLSVHLARVASPGARGQVFVLAGGPGQAGSSLAGISGFFPDFDLYLLDFRGTGASSYLDCDAVLAREDFLGCAERLRSERGATLDHFSTTASARDLGMLIGALRDERPVFVYGGSFGTYWANRYLQRFADQADGVIVEGLCPPGRCDASLYQDAATNEVARTLFGLCAQNATCNAKLGGDPWGFVGALFARVAGGGHCPELEADSDALRSYIALALFHPQARDYLPAVLYRYARCEPGDIEAVDHFNDLAFVGVSGRNALGAYSSALRFHVILSELLPDPPPTLAEVEALHETLYATGEESKVLATLADAWPRSPREDRWGALAETRVPMLMLQGTMDPATTRAVAEPFAETFAGDHQHYVELPYLTHGVLWHPCAQALVRQFTANPKGALDTACTRALPAPSFDYPADGAMRWLGTRDAWENGG
ncbi:MAG: alpha/beta fold hydrolase [Myxococcales bacterium]|nr:alpha/beta fold hydrolase [Myxococcales bacterium]